MSRVAMPGFGSRLGSDRKSWRAGRRPRRSRRVLLAERLEDRTLLAFQDLGGLRFSAPSFDVGGGTVSASGVIEVGLVPEGAEAFRPLLEVDGALSFSTAAANPAFTITDATVASVASASRIALLGATTRDFAVSDLLGAGSALADAQPFKVDFLNFSASTLRLANPGGGTTADSRLDLRGNLKVPEIGLTLPVVGNDVVTVAAAGVEVTGVTASDQSITAFGLTLNLTGLSVEVARGGGSSTFRLSGAVSVSDGDLSLGGSLGTPAAPGLVITDGQLEALDVGGSGSVTVASLSISADNLGFSYRPESGQYAILGKAELAVSGDSIDADFGTTSAPGMSFQGGTLVQANVALSGSFGLFGLGLQIPSSDPLRLQFQRGSGTVPDAYLITGKVSVPELFDAKVTLGGTGGDGKPQPGIEIVGGAFDVDDFTMALGAVPLGAFTVQTLVVSYAKNGDSFDFDATLDLVFPEGWIVGGAVDFVAGKVSEIAVSLNAGDTPVPIGDTGLFLQAMSATVQNINQPENLIVSGSLVVTLGEDVEIFGRSVVIAQASGDFTVDKNELILDADVSLAAETDSSGNTTGLLGGGKGMMTLDWGQQTYSLDVSATLLDGVFTFEASFSFDARGDITISAEADVNFPQGIPFIGGKRLVSLDFLFEYRAPTTSGGKPIGFVAAWLELDIFHRFDVGIQYDFVDRDKFSLIGTKGVDAIKAGSSNPAPQVFMYVSTFTVPVGATLGTLSVDWPTSGGSQTVAVRPGSGSIISQSQFNSANGLSLVPRLADPSSSVVNVVGSSTDRNASLPAGTYQLILTSDVQYATPPKFSSTFSYPTPTIQVGGIPANPGTGSLTVPLTGTVASAFAATTTASLYLDTNGSGYDGILIARNVPYSAGGFSAPVSLNGLLPLPYFVYAIINDGTNTPVRSAYSSAFTPTPPLSGTLVDLNNNQGVSGWTVYLDINNSGSYDPGADPSTTTGATGFYAFDTPQLPVNRQIGVGVVIPVGFQFINGSGGTNPAPITYNGTNPIVSNFNIRQLNAISGTVYSDANANGVREPGEAGLSGWTLYLDANANGLFDAGEVTATSNNSGNYTFLSLAPNTTYTVGLVSQPIGRQTGPKPLPPGTYTATIGAGPYQQVTGQDFGVQLLGAIRGSVVGQALQNGRLNPNETPIAGWTVQLRDATGKVIATTTSGADGSYEFAQVAPGNYTVTQILPPGWRQTSPAVTNVSFKPVLTPTNSILVGSVATADFDGDGHLDVAIGDYSSTFTILFGAGDGTFPQTIAYSLPGDGTSSIVALDADGDGRIDLAVGRQIVNGLATVNSAIDLFRNNGVSDRTKLFSLTSSLNLADAGFGTNTGTQDLVRGDFNKDGRDDLLVSILLSAGSPPDQPYFATLLSNGSGFVLKSTVDAPSYSRVAVGDLNKDGNLDFVSVLTGDGPIGFTVHYGDGQGNFPQQVSVNQGRLASGHDGHVALGDINGDGLLDVAVADSFASDVSYSLQQGAGTFGTPTAVRAADGGAIILLPPRLSLNDFNGDLRIDLAAFSSSAFGSPSSVSLFLNPGTTPAFVADGKLSLPLGVDRGFATGAFEQVMQTADVNADGLPDLLVFLPLDGLQFITLLNTTSLTPGISVSLSNVGSVTTIPAFENAQLGQVSGVLFDDINRNSRREAGEPGLSGQVVYLDLNRNGSRDSNEPTATTGPAGAYAFDGVRPGEYVVRIVPAPGKRITAGGANGIRVTIGDRAARASDFGLGTRLINPIPEQVVAESSRLLVVVKPTGAATSTLVYRLGAGAPSGVAVDPRTGALTWKPGEKRGPGSYPITVIAYDPFDPAVSDSETFRVTVTETPDSIQFVTALYRTVLGRTPDAKGLAFWAGRIDGGASRLDVARAFWESPEHRGLQVDALFLNYLGRKPEASTRTRLVKSLLSGASEASIARSLLTSEEYRRSHPTAESFINGLYRDVLGRTPDPAGLAFWTRAARFLGRGEIARRFLNSHEATTRQVSDTYRDLLGRNADPGGLAFWTQRLAKRKLTPNAIKPVRNCLRCKHLILTSLPMKLGVIR